MHKKRAFFAVALCIALCFASVGYMSMAIVTSPLDFNMVPYFIIISFGSGFMMKTSIALTGQEAPIKERGSVIATMSMFGAVGILIFTRWGKLTVNPTITIEVNYVRWYGCWYRWWFWKLWQCFR